MSNLFPMAHIKAEGADRCPSCGTPVARFEFEPCNPAGQEMERAKAILREQPESEPGFKLGSISYLRSVMGIGYGDAWGIMDELVAAGFISEADDHGRRTLGAP